VRPRNDRLKQPRDNGIETCGRRGRSGRCGSTHECVTEVPSREGSRAVFEESMMRVVRGMKCEPCDGKNAWQAADVAASTGLDVSAHQKSLLTCYSCVGSAQPQRGHPRKGQDGKANGCNPDAELSDREHCFVRGNTRAARGVGSIPAASSSVHATGIRNLLHRGSIMWSVPTVVQTRSASGRCGGVESLVVGSRKLSCPSHCRKV